VGSPRSAAFHEWPPRKNRERALRESLPFLIHSDAGNGNLSSRGTLGLFFREPPSLWSLQRSTPACGTSSAVLRDPNDTLSLRFLLVEDPSRGTAHPLPSAAVPSLKGFL